MILKVKLLSLPPESVTSQRQQTKQFFANAVGDTMAIRDKFDPEDYYFSPDGYIIFTEKYHLKRGFCCQSGCKHCPWKWKENQKSKRPNK